MAWLGSQFMRMGKNPRRWKGTQRDDKRIIKECIAANHILKTTSSTQTPSLSSAIFWTWNHSLAHKKVYSQASSFDNAAKQPWAHAHAPPLCLLPWWPTISSWWPSNAQILAERVETFFKKVFLWKTLKCARACVASPPSLPFTYLDDQGICKDERRNLFRSNSCFCFLFCSVSEIVESNFHQNSSDLIAYCQW